MTIEVTSPDFAAGELVPRVCTGDGEDRSPALAWKDLPPGTRQLALICDDPDAPSREPWVHWVIYNLPAETVGLPQGVPRDSQLKDPPGACQGRNSWTVGATTGYRGPAPPPGHGVHHYRFRLYALDREFKLQPGLDKKSLLAAIDGHVLAQGELVGTYQR